MVYWYRTFKKISDVIGSSNKRISPYKSTNFIHENDLIYTNL